MAVTITTILNYWNAIGVFSYVLPFLVVFAVTFAILKKTEVFGGEKPVITIVAASIGLLSLQFDIVPIFFSQIFPKFGVFLAVVLVIMILMTFTGFKFDGNNWTRYIGLGAAIIVVLWALADFAWIGGPGFGFGFWLYNEYLWSLIILGVVIGAIVWVGKSS